MIEKYIYYMITQKIIINIRKYNKKINKKIKNKK